MKNNLYYKILILILFSAISLSQKAGSVIDIWGQAKTVDTLENKSVGPGINYTKFELPDYPITAYMLTIDLKNPNNLVETFQAQNQVGKTEAMTSAFNRLSRDEHKTIAGVNGNFWIVSGQGMPNELLGVPHSGSMLDGEVITDPNGWNRGRGDISLPDIGFAMLDANKKMWVDDIVFNGKVTIPNIGEYPIAEVNRIRKDNELVLFNQYIGTQTTRTDNNGVEVFIKPIDGKWNINGDVECIVTRIISDKGANLLEEGESVLSGNGTARTFLENLSVGGKLSVTMGLQTFSDNQFPAIKQMITGNALVMRGGELTPRNYNEEYNSMLYPRTGIGTSQDGKTLYLIVIDKMGQSKGASTETMCGILKACGAYHATSMDGGGSAQMMLDGAIVNKPADGRERAVANGWFLFHNAPDDTEITRIEFDDYRIQVPSFSSYTPVILGYNKYGVLVDKNVSGFKLSCPETLGNIDQNHTFVASPNAGFGVLTAELNGITVSRRIEVIAGNLAVKLDSILMNDKKKYPIEVYSMTGDKSMPVDSKYLKWIIEDETICKIDEGVLSGMKNGRTLVTGILGDFKDTLIVNVEISESNSLIVDRFNKEDWKMTASSALKATFTDTNLPPGWAHGAAVDYVYSMTRAPYIRLARSFPLYSLPDSMKITLDVGDVAYDKVIISLKANNASRSVSKEYSSVIPQGDAEISIAMDDWFDTSDNGIFPIYFDNINFYINAGDMVENKAYKLAVREISLVYKDVNTQIPVVPANTFSLYPNPVSGQNLYLTMKENKQQSVRTEIYNLAGQFISSLDHGSYQGGSIMIPITKLSHGVYMLKVYENEQLGVQKFIVY